MKPQKDGTRSGKGERPILIAPEKNNKARKVSKTEQNTEKKNEPASQTKSPGGRKLSKTDIKGNLNILEIKSRNYYRLTALAILWLHDSLRIICRRF